MIPRASGFDPDIYETVSIRSICNGSPAYSDKLQLFDHNDTSHWDKYQVLPL